MNQPLAYVHPGAKIAKNVVIEPFTTIHNNVVIGDGTWIGSNVTIMEGARIGKNCNIFHDKKGIIFLWAKVAKVDQSGSLSALPANLFVPVRNTSRSVWLF